MPDPRNTINPETGRPIGEDRISPFTRRLPVDDVSEDIDESGGPEPEYRPPVPRPQTGTFVVADINDDDWKERAMEALFD